MSSHYERVMNFAARSKIEYERKISDGRIQYVLSEYQFIELLEKLEESSYRGPG